ncbi:MAG: bifunctional DNA-formamidopyrimidine glycosylase/DNA-(apurinic or apyrimidinic site) lyase, partial [Verrucomicrobia bacterium]|nr:bifunctional DNA-formamidopyrimidine glycosylase/DNA-(apurinic or apyrimidinic site) lyase [Verrucomicrobiota bacterium]
MPELPEVEVLVRHLADRVVGRTIRTVNVRDPRSLRHTTSAEFRSTLKNARLESVQRRGKYLVFNLRKRGQPFPLLGHLGMTGRMYLLPQPTRHPPHTTLVLGLGKELLVFNDPRRFGRMTLDSSALQRLGPEPLEPAFTPRTLREAFSHSRQPVKVKLLDQSVVAGIGNIYASEALFLARIHPGTPAGRLTDSSHRRLRNSIRRVLREAIRFGSTAPLAFGASDPGDGIFYYGTTAQAAGDY